MEIKELYLGNYLGKEIKINGWIRNHRKQAHFGFIDLFDGTCFKSVQIVYDETLRNFEEVSKLLA